MINIKRTVLDDKECDEIKASGVLGLQTEGTSDGDGPFPLL